MLGHCRGCLSRYGFQSKNSHVFLCQNVSNLVQSSLVFQTVFCLTASPPFTKRSKLREKTRASGSRDVSRLPQIETLLAGYVHTYDNFLLRVEEGGDENGERTRSSRSFPSPTPTSQDLARRLISLQWPISFFSVIAVVVFVYQHLFVFAEDYFSLEHESTEKDLQEKEKKKENTSSQARAKRHIGVPDHGGYQRLMATGSIVTSVGEENNTGPADSIDVVFTTYWQYPAKVRIILPEDKACIEDFRKRHNITGKLCHNGGNYSRYILP